MSDLLREARTEARQGNDTIKQQVRDIGSKFLNNVQISAQEAVYTVLGTGHYLLGGGEGHYIWGMGHYFLSSTLGRAMFKKSSLRGGLRVFEIISIYHQSLNSEFS